MESEKTSDTNTGAEWEERESFKSLVKSVGGVALADYEFTVVAWLGFGCRERGRAPAASRRTKAGPKGPKGALGSGETPQERTQPHSASSLDGPTLVPGNGSNLGAVTQPELSVAFAPGDLNICLQGR